MFWEMECGAWGLTSKTELLCQLQAERATFFSIFTQKNRRWTNCLEK